MILERSSTLYIFFFGANCRRHLKIMILYFILFRRSHAQIETFTVHLAKHCTEIGKDETVDLTLMSTIETLFRGLACLNGSFLQSNEAHMCCSVKNHGLNMADAETAFSHIRKMENLSLKNIVCIDCKNYKTAAILNNHFES